MKKPVRYKCGCICYYREGCEPSATCETHGEGIAVNRETIHIVEKEVSKIRKLDNHELVSVGDIMQFRIKDRLVQTEAKLICQKITAGELKKYLYDETEIEVYRPC